MKTILMKAGNVICRDYVNLLIASYQPYLNALTENETIYHAPARGLTYRPAPPYQATAQPIRRRQVAMPAYRLTMARRGSAARRSAS